MKKKAVAFALMLGVSCAGATDLIKNSGGKIVSEKKVGSVKEIVVDFGDRKEVGYLTLDGRYLLIGNLIDLKTGENLTARTYSEIRRVDFGSIPLNDAINIKFGSGGRKLVMVSDPDCPFCRKALDWLKNQNVDLYVFLFPLDIHPDAYSKSVKVLCSENPGDSLVKVKSGEDIQVEKCSKGEDMLKRHILYATKLNTGGTPMFITGTGERIEGLDIKALERYLNGEVNSGEDKAGDKGRNRKAGGRDRKQVR